MEVVNHAGRKVSIDEMNIYTIFLEYQNFYRIVLKVGNDILISKNNIQDEFKKYIQEIE